MLVNPPASFERDGWVIECEPVGIRVDSLGVELVPAVMTDEFDHHLRELLDDAVTDTPEPAPAARVGGDDWDVELRVLGQVDAVGTVEHLSPLELELAIYLAFNRDGATSDTIRTMLWPEGRAPKTFRNLVYTVRRKLGTGPDGEPYLSPIDPYGRYRLSPRVTTDWERFQHLAAHGDKHTNQQARGLIRGPAFQATTGYTWAFNDNTARIIDDTIADFHRDRYALSRTP